MSGETPPETQPKTRSTSRKAKIQSNPDRKLTSSASRSDPPSGWAIINNVSIEGGLHRGELVFVPRRICSRSLRC
jgi:hypothetical protein